MQDNDKYQCVSTKVSPEAFTQMQMLCKKIGITQYEFLQMIIDTLIRYMDGQHNLSPDMEQAMAIFDHLQAWKDAVNFADPKANLEVHEATYYFTQAGKHGTRAVHAEIPFMGEKIATCNIQEILEKTLCLLTPERYRRLRLLAVDMGTKSILSCIDKMITEHESEEDARAIRQGFEDNNRHEWGRSYDSPAYRQKKQRGADNLADRKRLNIDNSLFPEDDAQQEICTVDELASMEETENREADE